MAIACPICRFVIPEEDVLICENCGFDFVNGTESPYSAAIKMLRETGEKVSGSYGSISREKLDSLYGHIAAKMQEALLESRRAMEESIAHFYGKTEFLAENAEQQAMLEYFVSSQNMVGEGMSMAYEALSNMQNLNDVRQGQGQLELALSRIQQGAEHMQYYSVAMMNVPASEEIAPIDITFALEAMQKSFENMTAYLESNEVNHLRSALMMNDYVSSYLRNALSSYDGLQPETPEMENAGETAVQQPNYSYETSYEEEYDDDGEYEDDDEEYEDGGEYGEKTSGMENGSETPAEEEAGLTAYSEKDIYQEQSGYHPEDRFTGDISYAQTPQYDGGYDEPPYEAAASYPEADTPTFSDTV